MQNGSGRQSCAVIQAAELYPESGYQPVSRVGNQGETMEIKETHFTIGQLNAMLDISGPTLRYWEGEFAGILTPLRTPGGQRRYTDEHIKILKKIIRLKAQGLKLVEIKSEMERDHQALSAGGLNGEIDILTERISRAVRKEIQQFLQNSANPAEKQGE